MLLSISTTHQPAEDLSYLLHKHPDRVQSFDLSSGQAHVYYTRVSDGFCQACLLLDVDPVGLTRGKNRNSNFLLGHYVNDRPYVASSLLSTAIAQVFGTAMGGRCKDRPGLASTPLPLTAAIDVLPVRGGGAFLRSIFQPLGYQVEAKQHPLDKKFPAWGDSPYYSVAISGTVTLSQLLTHLYVLVPVFDNNKHYYVGQPELDKLLAKGEGWLAQHPEKETISRRYLRHQPSLFREAIQRLIDEEQPATSGCDVDRAEVDAASCNAASSASSLHQQRLQTVFAELKSSGARRVIDMGCGEGKLLKLLLEEWQFEQITGMDVSVRSLEIAHARLKVDRMPQRQAERLTLMHGSLIYRDDRFAGFDAATLVEVIEHLDPARLTAFERCVFEFARPKTVVVTTPNREYNVVWDSLPAGQFRHADHRFEWTRQEFQQWAGRIASTYHYRVRFDQIGPQVDKIGAPTQMAVFTAPPK